MGNERGFTLIELLVVILIIGILAAIALPTFLGQTKKAGDASAISNVTNLEHQVRACVTSSGNIDSCDTASEIDTQLPWGTGTNQVSAARYGSAAEDHYSLGYAKSGTLFMIVDSSAVGPDPVRVCVTSSGSYPSGSCKSGGIYGFGTF